MNTKAIGLALLLGSTGSIWLMGIQQCTPQEVCDGVDNDGDGMIDEDFDEDLDGYFDVNECSYGDDCVDSDPDIHPNNAEPADSVDNDCDGKVDEAQEAYTVRLAYDPSGEPLVGVPVWPGVDGFPYALTDSEGKAVFYLEQPFSVLTYNSMVRLDFPRFTLLRSVNSTVMDLTASTDYTLYFAEGYYSDVYKTYTGNVTDLTTTAPEGYYSDVDVYVGGNDTECVAALGTATSSSMAYSVSCTQGGWALAQETFYNSTDGTNIIAGTTFPSYFGMNVGSSSAINVSVVNSLNSRANLTISGQDEDVLYHDRYVNIAAPGFNNYQSLGYATGAASDTGTYSVETAALSGTLSGARYGFQLSLYDDSYANQQVVDITEVSSATASISAELLPVPMFRVPNVSRSSDLPGTNITVNGDENSDSDLFVWTASNQNASGSEVYNNVWFVSQPNVSGQISVPALPSNFTGWPLSDDPSDTSEDATGIVGHSKATTNMLLDSSSQFSAGAGAGLAPTLSQAELKALSKKSLPVRIVAN